MESVMVDTAAGAPLRFVERVVLPPAKPTKIAPAKAAPDPAKFLSPEETAVLYRLIPELQGEGKEEYYSGTYFGFLRMSPKTVFLLRSSTGVAFGVYCGDVYKQWIPNEHCHEGNSRGTVYYGFHDWARTSFIFALTKVGERFPAVKELVATDYLAQGTCQVCGVDNIGGVFWDEYTDEFEHHNGPNRKASADPSFDVRDAYGQDRLWLALGGKDEHLTWKYLCAWTLLA
jgi:hypothetical protein